MTTKTESGAKAKSDVKPFVYVAVGIAALGACSSATTRALSPVPSCSSKSSSLFLPRWRRLLSAPFYVGAVIGAAAGGVLTRPLWTPQADHPGRHYLYRECSGHGPCTHGRLVDCRYDRERTRHRHRFLHFSDVYRRVGTGKCPRRIGCRQHACHHHRHSDRLPGGLCIFIHPRMAVYVCRCGHTLRWAGVGMWRLPDSPRWLISKSKLTEAKQVLQRVRTASDAGRGNRGHPGKHGRTGRGRNEGLFQPSLRMPLIVGLGLAVFQQITGINTVIYYSPTIFKFAGIQGLDPRSWPERGWPW